MRHNDHQQSRTSFRHEFIQISIAIDWLAAVAGTVAEPLLKGCLAGACLVAGLSTQPDLDAELDLRTPDTT